VKFTRIQLILLIFCFILMAIGVIFSIISSAVVYQKTAVHIASPLPESDVKYNYTPIIKGAGSAESGEFASEDAIKININAATADEIEGLPGIGENTARSIVLYRKSNGSLKSMEDLGNINGIDPKIMLLLESRIYFGEYDDAKNEISEKPPSEDDLEARHDIAKPKEKVPEEPSASPPEPKVSDSGCGPGKININSASADELETLPKIGPATAENIIKYRNEHGRFKDVDALTDVKRIGPKTLDAIREMICAE
jgi:comEA protein